jgi:hypothetical protein
VLSGEATHTNFKVFGLNPPGLEPTIYRSRGEHANHYATHAVYDFIIKSDCVQMIYWPVFDFYVQTLAG